MKRGLLTKFTFSKKLGNRKKDESVSMEITTAVALKAKGYGDYKLVDKVNTSFDRKLDDNTPKEVYTKLKKEIEAEADAKLKELEAVHKESDKTKDEEIAALKAKLAKFELPKTQ